MIFFIKVKLFIHNSIFTYLIFKKCNIWCLLYGAEPNFYTTLFCLRMPIKELYFYLTVSVVSHFPRFKSKNIIRWLIPWVFRQRIGYKIGILVLDFFMNIFTTDGLLYCSLKEILKYSWTEIRKVPRVGNCLIYRH